MASEQPDSGQVSPRTLSPSGRREKKRVGFHSTLTPEKSPESASAKDTLQPVTPQIILPTYNNSSKGHTPLPANTPPNFYPPGTNPPGAPDARELSRALTRILTQEQELESFQQQQRPERPTPPRAPRPALRRDTSYDVALEAKVADQAEKTASQRQHRAMHDARHRADRLAVKVGTYSSAPTSRRNSNEEMPTFHPATVDSDEEEETREKQPQEQARTPPVPANEIRRRVPTRTSGDDHVYESPRDANLAAEELVKSHTRRDRHDLFQRRKTWSTSGTATPVESQNYALEYVPKPDRYRGGILASLLKLYSDDKYSVGTGSSGYNTPSYPGTPSTMTPRSSPPSGRSSMQGGRPKLSRSASDFFKHHRKSASTTSLGELMRSSSMLSAPGSGEISDQVAEKLRRLHEKKPKKDHRITRHIQSIISRHRYLLKLCRALMLYGAPTHRLEEYMKMSARVLEIEGQFLYIPSCMILSFDDSSTHTTEVKIVRVMQGIDLGRLRDVHNIYKDVVHDELGVESATQRLDEVMNQQPKFRTWVRVPMYGLASACVAPFAFEGRFIDLPIAFTLGCIVGVLQLVFAPSNELYAHVFEVTAAIITSFLARFFGSLYGGDLFCFSTLAQSSIALILPGYMVLCSSLELQSYNLVAGSVRMVHALIYTLFLGYGITIGASLYGMMDKNAVSETHCKAPLAPGWNFLFVPGFTICLCIVNQAKWRQTPAMLVMSVAGWAVNSYTSRHFQGTSQLSNMLGALTVGILANLYSRLGAHTQRVWLQFKAWWKRTITPRIWRQKRTPKGVQSPIPSIVTDDEESRPASPENAPPAESKPSSGSYSLAAAAMLPAIFVQVPSGLAINGTLLGGIKSADQITGNQTMTHKGDVLSNFDGTAFNVLLSVIQVAIGISVGLFMSALIVYPFGKRRSGLFSF